MGIKEAVETCFRKYVTFSGRASRSEYWYFCLFNFLVSIVLGFIDGFILGANGLGDKEPSSLLSNLYGLVTFLPVISVGVRRLHDINRSGWWYLVFSISLFFSLLFGFIQLLSKGNFAYGALGFAVSFIIAVSMIVAFCKKGTAGDNRFGPDPLQENSI